MKHLDDDKLLELALELPDEEEAILLKEHLSGCQTCREKYEAIKSRSEIIGSFDPVIENASYPLPQRSGRTLNVFMKAAAILIAGFAAGYFTSQVSQPQSYYVIGQDLTVNTPADTLAGFVSLERLEVMNASDYFK